MGRIFHWIVATNVNFQEDLKLKADSRTELIGQNHIFDPIQVKNICFPALTVGKLSIFAPPFEAGIFTGVSQN